MQEERKILKEHLLYDISILDDLFSRTGLDKTQFEVLLTERAKEEKCLKEFKKILGSYQSEYVQRIKQSGSGVIEFTNSPLKGLACGEWTASDEGIFRTIVKDGEVIEIWACHHPILPIERLTNIDSDTEKIKIAFFKDSRWRTLTVDRVTIASIGAIIFLADRGVEVNANNAKDLIKYLADVVALNLTTIPCNKSIGRLGWVEDEFIPYSEVVFDGDSEYKSTFDSVTEKGDFETWRKECIEVRKNECAKIVLASSFASAILEKLGTLSFITHMWGGTEAGKTVALMVGASVWGNPNEGKLLKTLKMTKVAFGRNLSFLHSVPFFGDELQLIKDQYDNGYDGLIMEVTEGQEKGRGSIKGIQHTGTWKCAVITSGEDPITRSSSGGGAKNRVIDIQVNEKVIQDGNYTSTLVKNNYGFAGKMFIEAIKNEDLIEIFKRYRKELLEFDTTEKQAISMAANLTADEIATKYIFKDNNALTVEQARKYLSTKADVDVTARAWDWLIGFIGVNQKRFSLLENNGELWGRIDTLKNTCWIDKTTLIKKMSEVGFDFDAVKVKWFERGQLMKNKQGRYHHTRSIYDISGMYISLNIPKFTNIELNDD